MRLLDLNLTGTFLSQVETFGRAGWQRSRWWALQQTGFAPPVDLVMAEKMMAAIKAISLLSDPDAQTMGQKILTNRMEGWTAQYGLDLVTATRSYAEAHAAFTGHGDSEAEDMAVVLDIWADKAARRRRDRASHMARPEGGGKAPSSRAMLDERPSWVNPNMTNAGDGSAVLIESLPFIRDNPRGGSRTKRDIL